MKLTFVIIAVFFVFAVFAVQEGVLAQCIPNGSKCQANGSLGNCCSKFCLQQPGSAPGYCTNR